MVEGLLLPARRVGRTNGVAKGAGTYEVSRRALNLGKPAKTLLTGEVDNREDRHPVTDGVRV